MIRQSQPFFPTIGEEQIALLERLSNACGVSGNEGEVRQIILEEVSPYADDLRVDNLGNVLVTRFAKIKNPTRVMLDAHMDEVGFMIVEEEQDGIFLFENVGGIDARFLTGKPVWVGKKHTPGVIGFTPVHKLTEEEKIKTIPIQNLRIDLGMGGGGLAMPGEWATFANYFQKVGPSVRGKALDDRLGVATLIELVKNVPPSIELLAAFTVQEEIGLRGARVAGYSVKPDLAVVIDATPAHDLPVWDGSENTVYNTRLGEGAAIYIIDRATISDSRLIKFITQTAMSLAIPYQYRQPGRGGTDAGAIHLLGEGIPSISISVPVRYAHTGVTLARICDWESVLKLVYATLDNITLNVLKRDQK